jgi:hypothetical protein
MTLAGEQELGRSLSNLKTPDVASQQLLEREKNNTKSAQNSSPNQPARTARAVGDDETSEQFKNSPSLKMNGREVAYQYDNVLQAECNVQLRGARHAHRHSSEIQVACHISGAE